MKDIDVTSCQDEIEINEVHIRNPNYKGKNFDPNYHQNKNKQILAIILAIQETTTRTMGTAIQEQLSGQTSQYISHIEQTC